MGQTTKEFLARVSQVRKNLAEVAYHEEFCTRCDGAGFLSRDDWSVTEPDGSCRCYGCKGFGSVSVKTAFKDPMMVRRDTIKKLLPLVLDGDYEELEGLRIIAREGQYWLILWDVFARAEQAARVLWEEFDAKAAEMASAFAD